MKLQESRTFTLKLSYKEIRKLKEDICFIEPEYRGDTLDALLKLLLNEID